jgi:hypothetical protein
VREKTKKREILRRYWVLNDRRRGKKDVRSMRGS